MTFLEMQVPQSTVHLLAGHYGVSTDFSQINKCQSAHYTAEFFLLQHSLGFDLLFELLKDNFPAFSASEVFEKVAVEHGLAVLFDGSEKAIEKSDFVFTE